jgi:hypothetical protein
MSWWDFGEDSGYDGAELALHRINCAFCDAKGNFEPVHHEAKKNPASEKTLNFDTLKCGNCGNFLMVSGLRLNSPVRAASTILEQCRGLARLRNSPNIGPKTLAGTGCRRSGA